jgi:gas vesicle protein
MSNTKTTLAIIAGVAIGALAGILFAPEKGSETRKKIASNTGDLAESLKNSFGDFVDNLKNVYAEAGSTTEKFKETAKAKMNNLKNEVRTAENPFS